MVVINVWVLVAMVKVMSLKIPLYVRECKV